LLGIDWDERREPPGYAKTFIIVKAILKMSIPHFGQSPSRRRRSKPGFGATLGRLNSCVGSV